MTIRRTALLAGLLAVGPARAAGAQAGFPLDPSRLAMRRDSFQVVIQGTALGTQVTELSADSGALVYVERTVISVLGLTQETRVVMDPLTLAPWSVDQTGQAGGQQADTHVTIVDGRVSGRAQTPGAGGQPRVTDVDTTLAPGTLDVNQLQALIPALPLADSASFTLPVFNAADASTTPFTVAVEGREDVTVPAGTFGTYRVVLSRGGEPQLVLSVSRDVPSRMVRMEAAGQPIVFELVR